MPLNIVCSGFLLRYPLGGHSFHHLQYLLGLTRLGHHVVYFEDYGWPGSCYDPARNEMTSDCAYGLRYLTDLFDTYRFAGRWCYLAENGSTRGSMSRVELARSIRDCDLYLNLSNINWIDELQDAKRRVLVDTDPVFTQIDGHGMGGTFDRYQVLFTYGENVHKHGCTMPTMNRSWLPTRQPVLLDLWPTTTPGNPGAAITTVMNWSAYGDHEFEGRTYGQKNREFEPYIDLPRRSGRNFIIALGGTDDVKRRVEAGGWQRISARGATRTSAAYQQFIRESKAEFCVAKHAYASTRCGWFSDRSTAYLASGRPVVLQDTGFSDFLPCGTGLLAFRTQDEALASLDALDRDYEQHCRASRAIVAEHFDARQVLTDLLDRSLS